MFYIQKTNNKQQQIQRKISSLTLMAIMVAGGMTFAVPGMVPEAYAANANLFVSAENSLFDNYMSGPQVIEVAIIDSSISDTNEGKGEPDVTVNGNQLRMVQATDGNWYGYFADKANAALADDNGGMQFGERSGEAPNYTINPADIFGTPTSEKFEADGLFYNDGFVNVVREPKSVNTNVLNNNGQIGLDDITKWPFIQLYTLSEGGNVVVQYNKGGGAQSTTLTFDTVDDYAGIELDRASYPLGAHVHATITDAWLNIDPTDEDSWTFNTVNGKAYYHVYNDNGANGENNSTKQVSGSSDKYEVASVDVENLMCEDCVLKLEPNVQDALKPVITIQDNADSQIKNEGSTAADADAWITDDNGVKMRIVTLGEGTQPVTITEQGPNSGIFGTYDENDDSLFRITGDAKRGTSATIDYNDSPVTVLVTHAFATIDIQPASDVWNSGELIPVVLVDADININSRSDQTMTLSDPEVPLIPSLSTGSPITLGSGADSNDQIKVYYGNSSEATKTDVEKFSHRVILDSNDANVDEILIDLGITAGELQSSLLNTEEENVYGHNLFNYGALPAGATISLVYNNGSITDYADDKKINLVCNVSGSNLELLDKDCADAPVVKSINRTATVGQKSTFTVFASDRNGDSLTYTVANNTNIVTNATITDKGLFSWTPVAADIGDKVFTVTVTDSTDLSGTGTVTITVNAAAPTTPVDPTPTTPVDPTPTTPEPIVIPLLYNSNSAYESQHFGTAFDIAVSDYNATQTSKAFSSEKLDLGTTPIQSVLNTGAQGAVGTYTSEQLRELNDTGKIGTDDGDIVLLSYSSAAQSFAESGDGIFRLTTDTSRQVSSVVTQLIPVGTFDNVISIHLNDAWSNDYVAALEATYDDDHDTIAYNTSATDITAEFKSVLAGLTGLDSRTAIVILEFDHDRLDTLVTELARTGAYAGISNTKFIIPDVPSGAFGITISADALDLLKATDMKTIKFALSDNTADQTALKDALLKENPDGEVKLDGDELFDRHAYSAYDAGQILAKAIDGLGKNYTSAELAAAIPTAAAAYSSDALIYRTVLDSTTGDLECMVYDIFEINDVTSGFILQDPTQLSTNDTNCPVTSTPTPLTPTVPGAPTNLVAQGRNAEAALSWDTPTGVVTGYIVQQSTDAGTNWTPSTFTVSGTTAMVTGLTNDQAYYFRVLAENTVGTGSASNVDMATPSLRVTAPEQVTGLNATAGDGTVTLEWNQPHDGNSPILNYTVQYSVDNANTFTVPPNITITGTTAEVTGLTNGVNHIFRVSATNAEGTGPASNNAGATPTAPEPNADPVITSVTGARTVTVDQSLTLTVVATDTNTSDTLTYTANNTQAVSANNDNVFTFTAPATEGTVNILFTVSDDNGGSATQTVTITVNAATTNGGLTPANAAPVLDPIGDKLVNVGTSLIFTVNATDAENDDLAYTMSPDLTGATLARDTGIFTWDTPIVGEHAVTITVRDASGMDSEDITITVNRLPILASIGAQSGPVDTELTISLSATDADGDTVRFTISPPLTGATIGNYVKTGTTTTATFTWTPTVVDTYNVMITAADEGGTDSEPITITITDPAPTPVVYPPRVAFDAAVTIPMIYNVGDATEEQFFGGFGPSIQDYQFWPNATHAPSIQKDIFYNDYPIAITSNPTRDIENIIANGSKAAVGTYTSEQLKNLVNTGKVGHDVGDIVLLSYASTATTLNGTNDGIFRLTTTNQQQADKVLKPELSSFAKIISIHRGDEWSNDYVKILEAQYGANHDIIAYNSSLTGTALTGDIMSKLRNASALDTIAANTAIVILGFGEVKEVLMELSMNDGSAYDYAGIDTTKIFIPDLSLDLTSLTDGEIELLKDTDMKTIKFALNSDNAGTYDNRTGGIEYDNRHVYAAYDAGQILVRAIDELGKEYTAEQLKTKIPEVASAYSDDALIYRTVLGANGDLECMVYDVLEIADDATAADFTYKAADPKTTDATNCPIPTTQSSTILNNPQTVSCIDCAINSFGEIFGQTVQVHETTPATEHLHNPTVNAIFDINSAYNVGLLIKLDEPKTIEEDPIVLDFFSFGLRDGERVSNQIVRLELEETGDNTNTFVGGLEYTMLNQLNILDKSTYTELSPISDEPTFIVMEDLTDEDSPRVNYFDKGADGVDTQIADQQAAPSHSGVVSLDSKSYKVADTVIVTLEDADLNVDSDLIDIFTVVKDGDLADTVGKDVSSDYGITITESGNPLGRVLDVTFDDEIWADPKVTNSDNVSCKVADDKGEFAGAFNRGLSDTGFTLIETETASGVFTGSFQIPDVYCKRSGNTGTGGTAESVTGTDIEVNYLDYRDASGEIIEVGDGAGVRASTGSISLDRTVYPVPFADNAFPLHPSIDTSDGSKFKEDGASGYLPQGDAIIHVRVSDPDYDLSASGEDTIATGTTGPVEVTVSRGQASKVVATAGAATANATANEYGPITEIAPDAGIFEADIPISYKDGPTNDCPVYPNAANNIFADGCILQGDIITVQYEDPTDASGEPNTITDSATFDLRNAVLQSGKSVYIIGSDMILTLIEPDFDLDNDGAETYPLDLIEWDSDAGTTSMGKYGTDAAAFDPEPADFRETGDSTGVFQVVVEIPAELGGDKLERGEEIELEYTDWGPSGSDHVGDEDEDINLTLFTSNFGSTVELDQKVYTWTDKVYITIVAPDHNFDTDLVDEIGNEDHDPIKIATRGDDLDQYKLVETGPNTGIFTGEVILTGFAHDANGDGTTDDARAITGDGKGQTDNLGPTNGFLSTEDDDGLSVSFEFSEDETVIGSALIRWNIGEVQWLEASYAASGTGVVRVIDPDMNLNPESVDNFEVNIWSDSDVGGIDLTVTETNQATGIFEGTTFFTVSDTSSGHRLRVSEGDTVTAEYNDRTLPDPHDTSDEIDITATTQIGSIIPPLERAPATNLRVVDAFSNTLDTVDVDQQVQITADLANGQDKEQPFAYIVQIQDSSSVTVALAWVSGTLTPSQSFSPALSWTPSEAGKYTATAFVWESVDNPTALSPPNELTITVN